MTTSISWHGKIDNRNVPNHFPLLDIHIFSSNWSLKLKSTPWNINSFCTQNHGSSSSNDFPFQIKVDVLRCSPGSRENFQGLMVEAPAMTPCHHGFPNPGSCGHHWVRRLLNVSSTSYLIQADLIRLFEYSWKWHFAAWPLRERRWATRAISLSRRYCLKTSRSWPHFSQALKLTSRQIHQLNEVDSIQSI